ncbi:serine/threonine protein kinase [Basidiobolus ranarum]|uniref:Serine/threonine protein kinase n=1 Tax=Basidiobolus ranarum TaxID=34480 RepID=A0ABR2VXD1_9FUNG
MSLNNGFQIPFHGLFDAAQNEHMSDFSSISTRSSDSSLIATIPSRFVFKAIRRTQPKKPRQDRLSELPLFVALKKLKTRQSIKELYGTLSIISSTTSGSVVYTSFSPQTKQNYAIKVFRFRYTHETHREYCLSISNEIYIATSLSHKNIIRTIDVLEENGRMYKVMEYCPYDLISVFEKTNPTEDEGDQYFVELIHGLAYLHHRGVAHRDLKLENLCLDKDGHLKIIDFGFATLFRNSSSHETIYAKGVFGSNGYIAPEVWTRESYDPSKGDIWALGILYVGMRTRKFPWERATIEDSNFELFSHSWDAIRLFDQCPPESIPLLKWILEIEPSCRATIQDIVRDPWFQSLESKISGSH